MLFLIGLPSIDRRFPSFSMTQGHLDSNGLENKCPKNLMSSPARAIWLDFVAYEFKSLPSVCIAHYNILMKDHKLIHSPHLHHQNTLPAVILLKTKICKKLNNQCNPVTLVFIVKLSQSSFKWIPMWRGSNDYQLLWKKILLRDITMGGERVRNHQLIDSPNLHHQNINVMKPVLAETTCWQNFWIRRIFLCMVNPWNLH